MATVRKTRCTSVVTPLEQHVPVNWTVVGTPGWFSTAWHPGALDAIPQVVVTTQADVQPVLDHLWSMPVCGIDTETAGPYKEKDAAYSMNPINPDTRMVLLQIGNHDHVYLIEPALIPAVKAYLESDQVLHVGHNLSYDFKWLLVKYGVHLQRMYCSMLAEQLLTAGLSGMRVNLADSVRRREPFWIINKAIRDHFIHLGHTKGCPDCAPGEKRLTREMGYYAARDIALLFPLMREQSASLKQWKLVDVAKAEFDIIPATAEMELGGVPLHRGVMRQIIEHHTIREQRLTDEFFTLYRQELQTIGKQETGLFPGVESTFNLKSPAAKMAALKELDLDLDNITRATLKETSQNTTLKPSIRRMLEIFMEITNAFKMTSTYGTNMVGSISPVTGLWHPRFWQLGSGDHEGRRSGSLDKDTIATGRYSSNAQQFPKPKDEYAEVVLPSELQQVSARFVTDIATIRSQYASTH